MGTSERAATGCDVDDERIIRTMCPTTINSDTMPQKLQKQNCRFYIIHIKEQTKFDRINL